jgi:hypothetical protein
MKMITILLLILILGFGIVYFAVTWDLYIHGSYESDIYGKGYRIYLEEIHEKYGDTFEQDEFEEWVEHEQDNWGLTERIEYIIQSEPLFQKYPYVVQSYLGPGTYGERNVYEYYGLDYDTMTQEQKKEFEDIYALLFKINDEYGYLYTKQEDFIIVREHYDPLSNSTTQNYVLSNITGSYYTYENEYTETMPDSVMKRIEKFKTDFPNNTTNLNITYYTSAYFTVTGIFVLVGLMFLLIPYVVGDKVRKMRTIQYSAKIGRKLFNIQFLAVIASAVILTVASVIISFIPYAFIVNFGDYHSSHLGNIENYLFFMFNITLTQYILFLMLLIMLIGIGFASMLFFLGKYSGSFINFGLKSIPCTIGFAIGLYACLVYALFAENALFAFFDFKLHTEIIVSLITALAGGLIGLSVLYGERKREY